MKIKRTDGVLRRALSLLLALAFLPLCGELAPETLDAALEKARARRLTEATALLLETRRSRPGAGRAKKFEL